MPIPRPSGKGLPLFLLKKWRKENDSTSESETRSALRKGHRITAEKIEERKLKTSLSIVEIQKQIFRGEECYYEETASHGNIFKNGGWDSFVDAKDVVGDARTTGQQGGRRVPNDARWFSGSCVSAKKVYRPPIARSTNAVPKASGGNVATSIRASIRSENNSPVPVGSTSAAALATASIDMDKPGISSQTKKRKEFETDSSDQPQQKRLPNQKNTENETERDKARPENPDQVRKKAEGGELTPVQTESKSDIVDGSTKDDIVDAPSDDGAAKKREDVQQKRRFTRNRKNNS